MTTLKVSFFKETAPAVDLASSAWFVIKILFRHFVKLVVVVRFPITMEGFKADDLIIKVLTLELVVSVN